MSNSLSNAHQVLGVNLESTPAEVRQAYLGLVRLNPPDRDADKFREIHTAYQLLSDPMVQAESIMKPRLERPDLLATIATAEKKRPRLSTFNLLALGNSE